MTICENPACGNVTSQPDVGRRRRWCSDKCRKVAPYARYCTDCGARLNGSDGHGPNAPTRCMQCAPKVSAPLRKKHEQRAEVARLWAEGKTLREIAAALGMASPESAGVMVVRYRAEGIDLPLRRPRWTDEMILAAIRTHAAAHGGPPTCREWVAATASHPATGTVMYVFGSWNAAISAAGFVPREQGFGRLVGVAR